MKTVIVFNGTRQEGEADDSESRQRISSPWDVCFDMSQNKLIIAMAGYHQIWALYFSDENNVFGYVTYFFLFFSWSTSDIYMTILGVERKTNTSYWQALVAKRTVTVDTFVLQDLHNHPVWRIVCNGTLYSSLTVKVLQCVNWICKRDTWVQLLAEKEILRWVSTWFVHILSCKNRMRCVI